MNTRTSVAPIAAWLLLVGSAAAAPDARLEALEEQAVKQAAALVSPSIVRIDTVGGLDLISSDLAATGTTTGLVVATDGYLVSSAFHFAAKPSSILVTLADGRRFPAKLVATDRQRMVALLKIDASGLVVPQAAPRTEFRVGQWTIALGRTLDADAPSVSLGIVSAVNRVWGKAVQTDAKVSPVNYGGPLVDIEGRVMGLLAPLSPQATGETAGVEWYDSGIGFAVPLEDILAVVDRLKGGEDLQPGLLGVTFQGRDAVGSKAVIDRVRYASPAEKVGLKKGDRIVSADGTAIESVAELRSVLGRKYAGDSFAVTIERNENRLDLKLELVAKLPPYEPAYLGILPERTASTDGVVIREILPDSPAKAAGLLPRDRITAWNNEAITTASQLAERISRQRPGERGTLSVVREKALQPISVTLTGYPDFVPEQLPAAVLDGTGDPAPKTGRQVETLAGHDREYWLYVPESYRQGKPFGLMIFLHPGGDSLESTILRSWKPECERRGLIVLGPKADSQGRWTPNDLEFIHDCVAHVREQYAIAGEQIFLHATGNAVPLATMLAFRERSVIRGLAVGGMALRGSLPDNDPDERLQWHVAARAGDRQAAETKDAVELVRKARFPIVFKTYADQPDAAYLPEPVVEELARWADMLDRI